ncbi:MAG: restriction endonuclease subunit S, partial [Coleofasciculus sp. S288]|nr:restriction endonuclease subunit S [Coleofasciculus sp. S288]
MTTETRKLPEGWRWVTLKDVARLERGKFSPRPRNDPRYYKGAYPWIQTGDVEAADKYIKTYRNTLNELGLAVSKMFPKGTLIITIAATIGAVGILTFDSCMPDSLVAITPKEEVSDTEFLYYLLLFLRKEVKARATQSAQANINLELLEPIEIPLPPLAEQKRIAAIAQKADRLRRTRRYALQLSDTYLQSVFLEMFGSPVTNPKGWDIEDIGSQIISIRYGTSSPPEYQQNGIPFIRATNIKKGYIQPEGMVYISEHEAQKIPKCKVKAGDLIIVRSGVNTGDSAVVTELYDGTYAAYDLIVELPKIQAYYYNFLINSDYGKAIIEPLTRRAGQPHINAEQVSSLRFPLPLLPLQEKFAQIVQKFERLRTQQREADRQAEHLFQTLLHRAFRGELAPQHINDEPASVLLEEIGAEQAQAEAEAKAATQAMGDAAEYLGTKAKQQDTEPIQLKLPGIE